MSNFEFVEVGRAGAAQRARQSSARTLPVFVVSALAALVDLLAVLLFGAAADLFYNAILLDNGTLGLGPQTRLYDSVSLGLVVATVFVAVTYFTNGYRTEKLLGTGRHLLRTFQAWIATFLIVVWIGFLTKFADSLSRGSVLLFFAFGGLAVWALRLYATRMLRRFVADGKIVFERAHLLSYGSPEAAEDTLGKLRASGINVVGSTSSSATQNDHANKPALWARRVVQDIRLAMQNTSFDAVYVDLPWDNWELVAAAIHEFNEVPLPVYLFAARKYQSVLSAPQATVAGRIAFQVERGPLTLAEQVSKRVFDLIISSLGIVLLSPLLLAVSLAIFLTSGRGIIFKQQRRGFGGRPFNVFKFRTMSVTENGDVVQQAKREDARVTPIGRLLRRTSIDELPQLFNVFLGHMSIVGPRPHALAHDNHYDSQIATYAFRQHVKPGITGWAQIHGLRGETTEIGHMEERVKHDLWYINNWSFLLDVSITLRTAIVVLFDRTAY